MATLESMDSKASSVRRAFFSDLSLPAATAGFVAVLVGFTSTIALVFQAALAFGATPAQIASWIGALGLGMGLCSALPSLWLKKPVMVAWSTPGAAVLAAGGLAGGFTLSEATGAFMVSAALMVLFGMTGWFEKILKIIPPALAAALLAGVLTRFALQTFTAAQTALPLVLSMLAAYCIGRRWLPRYAVVLTLAVGLVLLAVQGRLALPTSLSAGGWLQALAIPEFVAPVFSFQAFFSLALPLFVVTMASQNLPGAAAITTAGYGPESANGGIPVSKIITLTGLVTLFLAPFGAFSLGLAAITAAMCMGPHVDSDPARRYTAAVCCGFLYVLTGVFGGAVALLLAAFPAEFIAAIAGLALLGTIASALQSAMQHEAHREAALITFLVTLSGVVLGGIGSAFWGTAAGLAALLIAQVPPWVRR